MYGLYLVYLLCTCFTDDAGNHQLFNKKDTRDTVAFLVSMVLGINLGITGIIGTNIGMTISSTSAIFMIIGLIYLVTAGYLYKRWNESEEKIF